MQTSNKSLYVQNYLPLCFIAWFFKLSDLLNFSGQYRQENGFSPVCTLSCRDVSLWDLNLFPQYLHEKRFFLRSGDPSKLVKLFGDKSWAEELSPKFSWLAHRGFKWQKPAKNWIRKFVKLSVSDLCLHQFDIFLKCSAYNHQKRKLCKSDLWKNSWKHIR